MNSDDDMSPEIVIEESTHFRCLKYNHKFVKDIYFVQCGEESGGAYATEGREGYHLHAVLAGKGYLHVRGEVIAIHYGQLFVTKPGEKCHYEGDSENPWRYCWMTFDGKDAQSFIEGAGFSDGVYVVDCKVDMQGFLRLVRRTMDHSELSLANDLMRLGHLFEFLSLVVESNYRRGSVRKHQYEYSPDIYVQQAVDLIRCNYAIIKITDISKDIGINRSYLTTIFKQKIGVSPQEYLVKFKLGKAAQLLLETDLPVQDISRKAGYPNPLTFSKMFKRTYGVSPREYRKSGGKEEI